MKSQDVQEFSKTKTNKVKNCIFNVEKKQNKEQRYSVSLLGFRNLELKVHAKSFIYKIETLTNDFIGSERKFIKSQQGLL